VKVSTCNNLTSPPQKNTHLINQNPRGAAVTPALTCESLQMDSMKMYWQRPWKVSICSSSSSSKWQKQE
jgi:hypothetical protein